MKRRGQVNHLSPEYAAERLVSAWLSRNVKLNPPAGSTEICKLEQVFGGPIPHDLAAFYSLANGMADYETDKYCMSFWSINRILNEMHKGKPTEIWFADFMICSWGFFYRPIEVGRLIIGSDYDSNLALPSFGTFLDLYLNDPKQLGL